jgi:hypothetical protein
MIMALQTRKPTGKPPWPIALIAGGEKSGKSWACAEASGSALIGRTLWFSTAEDDPDEYGAVPGARFEIVLHDGTYRGLLNALTDASREPQTDGKPTLWVIDSGTRLWDLLSDMAQTEANRRRHEAEAKINMDLWNVAKSRWQHVLDMLRSHNGPSIITARLETVTVVEDGQPVKGRDGRVLTTSKIKAEKNLPYDVGLIIEQPRRGEAYLTGYRSVKLAGAPARIPLPDFTFDKLWRDLGLAAKDATGVRHFAGSDGIKSVEAEDQLVRDRTRLVEELRGMVDDNQAREIAATWQKDHGHKLGETTDIESLAALVATHKAMREPARSMITEGQSKKLHAMFTEAGMKDRDHYLAWASTTLGYNVETTKELTSEEAGQLLDKLALWTTPEPAK